MEFKFKLNDRVTIIQTGHYGNVVGKVVYLVSTEPMYMVKHVNGQGDLVSTWYDEKDLELDITL